MSFTPGPWFYRTSGDGFIIRSKTAIGPIAGVNGFRPIGEAEANAHRIVTAVNAFDDMKAALRVIRQQWAGHSEACAAVISHNKNKCDCDWPKIAAQCDAALTKAEGHIGQELAPDPERRGESAQ